VTKQWPIPTGGGLGVARQFFLGLAKIGLEGRDVWAVCGTDVIEVKYPETCLRLADDPHPPGSRLRTTMLQIQAIRRLAVPGATVIAFTPFYAWPLLRIACPDIQLVHVEQSKGGRHHELAAFRGRFGWKERIVQAAVALNFHFPHKIVFPSRGALSLFVEKNPSLAPVASRKGIVIHNGVETAPSKIERARSEEAPFQILSVCEDVPEKGLLDSLRTVEILYAAGMNVEFHHFGSVRDETKRVAEGLEIPAVFHGLRPRADILAAMQQADLFMHLPQVAVFDLVLIEAMSAGLPVVTTPVGGNVEALGDDYPHFAGSPEDAAAEIQKVTESQKFTARTGQALRTRAEDNFTAVAMARGYLEI